MSIMLNRLVLNNFRKFKLQTFDFTHQVTVIVGANAAGKTSIVEAIYLLSSGDSFRASKIEEMIGFDEELSRVQALLDDSDKLEIILTRGQVQGKRSQYRLFSLNDVKKRKKDFVGQFLAVEFRPEDMRLVEGSKSRRRHLLDETLSALDWQYAHALGKYEEALKKTNRLLFLIREGQQSESVLTYWNMALVKHGQYLQQERQKLLQSFSEVEFPLRFAIEYLPSVISEMRIKQYQKPAIAAGHILVGPHKDDFVINLDEKNIAAYGSRGQQRMAVLWLKICQLEFLESKSEQKAILLLDDILSELDQEMKQKVLELLAGRQTIISSADERVLKEIKSKVDNYQVIMLS